MYMCFTFIYIFTIFLVGLFFYTYVLISSNRRITNVIMMMMLMMMMMMCVCVCVSVCVWVLTRVIQLITAAHRDL